MPELDAEALYATLREQVRSLLSRLPQPQALVGIWSGGAWLAERLHADLHADLKLQGAPGVISSTLHRDDFHARGLSTATDATNLPFEIDGCHIVLVDDVLYTGRTVRAVVNELFDFGRPASVTLAVLVDRGGRQLPMAAAVAAVTVDPASLPPQRKLTLARCGDERLSFTLQPSGEGP